MLRHRINPVKQYEIYKLLDWIDIDKINWHLLSENPNAIHLLEKNKEFINWNRISTNPSIFTYNYKELKQRMKDTIAEDLMKNRFHPKYMDKWLDWGQVEADDLL